MQSGIKTVRIIFIVYIVGLLCVDLYVYLLYYLVCLYLDRFCFVSLTQDAIEKCSALLFFPFISCHENIDPNPFVASCVSDLCV